MKTNRSLLGATAILCTLSGTMTAEAANEAIYAASSNGFAVQSMQQQSITVKGTITDNYGAVIGASVVVKGTTNGTVTDMEGNFVLTVNKGDCLVISYVGYKNQEIIIKDAQPLSIKLAEDTEALDEVVVVGYGTQKKANLTGSVASIDSKQLGDRALTSVAAGMQGTMPGVTIKSATGRPGQDDSAGSIRVRGTGTFNNASPMVIVDGMESTLYDLDPNDIESISVLKDAASAAIYGSKAANGVIVVTTKRGKAGTSQISYSGNVGWQSPTRLAKYVSSADYARLTNEARRNEGLSDMYTEEDIRLFEDGTDPDGHPNTDWLGLLYDNSGLQTQHNLNINGGSEKIQYMTSLGYTHQEGLIRNNDKDKYNIRLNLDSEVTSKLSTSFSMAFTREDIDYPAHPADRGDDEFFGLVTKISPMVPCYKTNGDYGYIGDGNPIAWLDSGVKKTMMRNNLQSIGSLKYQLLPELSVKAIASYKLYTGETHTPKSMVKYTSDFTHGSTFKLTEEYYRDDRITGDILLEYKKAFSQKHNLNILAGYHSELYRNYYLKGYRENFPNQDLTDLDAGGSANQSTGSNRHELSMLSYFGRINYDYLGRYLIEANARYDGTSRFARGNRWGLFPSVSIGWCFSEEAFFEKLKNVVNYGKLRASWGQLGNQDIGGYYPTVSTISLGVNYPLGGVIQSGGATQNAVNKDLKWETTTTYDIGLDLTLFGSLNITMDYYNKTTSDILMNMATPFTFALNDYYANVGKVSNNGFEFSATYNGRIGQVNYNIGGNVAFNKNEIKEMGSGDQYINDSNGATFAIMRTGEAMNSFYGYKTDGFFATDAEAAAAYPNGTAIGYTPKAGDLRYIDANGDGKLDGEDRQVLGSWDPGITFGFNLGLQWNGFDFTAMFQGAADVYGYVTREGVGYINGDTSKPTTIWLNHWTPENQNPETPRLILGMEGWSMPTTTSDFWMQNATYLRMKTLQIGYTLPKKWLQKIKLDNIRLYYTAENLLTFTGFMDGYDPESPVSTDNLKGNNYPQTKTHSFGVNITF